MIELACHILDTKAAHFDPSEFKDEYENALKALVRRKVEEPPKRQGGRKVGSVAELVDKLKTEARVI